MGFKKYLFALAFAMFNLFDAMERLFFRLIYGKTGNSMPAIRNILLLESASSIAFKIRTKKLTSLEVVNSFIERIEEINPILNCAVADRFAEARKEATYVDDLINAGNISEETLAKEKPFLGVPFTTKDCIAVKGLIHSSGLWSRRNIKAAEDAEAVTCLRNAGAIPIALTNVSELCMWWESSNVVHGRTNNPYDTNHIVGGSSGGEGCIQGAAGSAFGIGSDIGGSIRMPAFFNGVFGHKPSKFIVSNVGQYPVPVTREQHSFLGIGPICRRAEDLLPLLKIIANKNAESLRLDEKVDVRNIRFFYQESDTGALLVSSVNSEIKDCFKRIILHMDKAYKMKLKKVELQKLKLSKELWIWNMKNNGPCFREQLANMEGSINIPWELFKWLFGQSSHTFIGIMTALIEKTGPGFGSPTYYKFVEIRNHLQREIMDLLGDDGVLLYPTHPTAAPYHNEPLFKPFNFSYTGVINVLQFPATHIPMGLNKDGLPIGIQVIANDKCDRLCLAVAREMEKAFGGWTPPAIEA